MWRIQALRDRFPTAKAIVVRCVCLVAYGTLAAAFGVAAQTPVVDETSVPAPLIACEEARKAWVGRFQWQISTFRAQDSATIVRRYISTIARNGDWGLEEVLAEPKTDGSLPMAFVRNREGDWDYPVSGSFAGWYTDPAQSSMERRGCDIRWTAIFPDRDTIKPSKGFRAIYNDPMYPIERWTTSRAGDVYTVRGTGRGGALFEYTIDSARDWSIERARFKYGPTSQEMRAQLELVDGKWLPVRSEYLVNGEVQHRVEITGASVGPEAAPPSLDLGSFGAEPGVQISIQDADLPPHLDAGGPPVWNGEYLTSFDQWREDLKRGLREWGPSFKILHATKQWPTSHPSDQARAATVLVQRQLEARVLRGQKTGLWREYVEAFIKRFELDAAQSEKAMQVLADCERLADEYLTRKEPAIKQIIGERHAAQERGDPTQVSKLKDRLAGLLGPLDDIFEKRLKPRLEQIPTRAQLLKVAVPAGP